MGRDDRAVILPPARERERALDHVRVRGVAVDLDRHGELRADFWLDAEQGEYAGVGRGLVRALAGQDAFDGFDEIMLCLGLVHAADFDMALVERHLARRHADHQSCTVFLDKRVILQLRHLRFGQILERAVHVAARLPEVALLERGVDGHGDGEQRSKQHGRQRDRDDRNDVARFRRLEAAVGQAADALFVGDVQHIARPLTNGRCGRPRCGRSGARAGRSPRCG